MLLLISIALAGHFVQIAFARWSSVVMPLIVTETVLLAVYLVGYRSLR